MPFAVYALWKSFGGVEVLKGVDLEVANGEIHALLGANGAGKSTLINCLGGILQPDSGVILVGADKYDSLTPRLAKQAGVAVIHQDPALAASLSVSDNIFLGQERRVGPFINRKTQAREAKEWLAQLGADIRPSAVISGLGNADLQTVEIAKALSMRPQVLILDEPTAALSEHETVLLGRQMIELKRRQLPMLYVTHRLAEVFAIADKVSVLRGGKVVLSGLVPDFTHDDLVNAITGQRVERLRPPLSGEQRDVSVEVDGLMSAGIGPVTFNIRRREIVGVFGLVGSGRTELVETLFGARQRNGGTFKIDGQPIAAKSPVHAVIEGVALVPSDRLRKSIVGTLPSKDNALFPSYRRLARMGIRRFRRERASFFDAVSPLSLQPPRIDLEAKRFSGGNQQKLVIARWLNDVQHCRFLMLDEPTQGVDVGARHEIYAALRAYADAGNALLVTSSEPEELLQIADRVVVLHEGQIAGIIDAETISEAKLLELAHNVNRPEGRAV